MMDYIKRRLFLGDFQNESTDIIMTRSTLLDSHMNIPSRQSIVESKLIPHIDASRHSIENILYPNPLSNIAKDIVNQPTRIESTSSQSRLKEKSKLLFVIDDEEIDWSKYFQHRKIFADYDIRVEQAQFKEINLSAYSHGGILINIDVYRNGKHMIRSFRPDFVLVRQYVTDINVNWINIILAMQYGAVPSINSMRALYNFRDKPWIFAELLKIQQRLGAEQFPLISQVYYPNHRKMFISPQFPSVIKIGQAHQGLGKIKIENSYDYHDLRSIISMSKCYSTIEPYINGQCDIYIQKIGNIYKAFSRKSLSGNWKTNIGSSIIQQIEMTDRYRLWIDEVSQIFGGLDICAIEVIKSINGKEYIIKINDCTMQLLKETQEEDCQSIAELIMHQMQIYCRPDQEISILTRIPSFDELPKLPQNNNLKIHQNGNIRQSSNTTDSAIMLSKSTRLWTSYRSVYPSIINLSSRRSLNTTKVPIPSRKLTKSYYYHASEVPLLYHTVGQHLDGLAFEHPDHQCYVFKGEGNKRYTYKSFLDEVDSLAASLIELGYEKNDRIGVWLPNTSENCVLTYAASKVGVIKVNINPAYMDRELAYCLNKVGCKGLVMRPNVKIIDCIKMINKLIPELNQTKGEINSKALPTLKHIILTTGDNGNLVRVPQSMHSYTDLIRKGANTRQDERRIRQSQLDGDTPLAIFYTSGTTGEPKAATLTNYNMLNNNFQLCYTYPELMSRVCCPIPTFHIFGEIAGTLNINAPKYFTAFPSILPDTVDTMRTVHEEKCTALVGAPIIFRDILSHPKRKEFNMSSLVFAILGAAPVNPALIEQLEREIPIKIISQGYGQTENSASMAMSVFAQDDKQRRYSSVGKALPRIEMKIADSQGHILPIGQEGEICARGFNIMKGYYGDDEKTRETITASGWLRTGDVGIMDEQGFVYYRSRQKEMVIVGGINVYPVEVENFLLEHPNIAEAQVFGMPDKRYGEVLCAWIKLKPGTKIDDVEEVRTFLSSKVAFFKVPKYVKIVESFLPFTTPTGKIQKFKLTEAMLKQMSSSST
ncbi:unnamed protein product [Rotaria sp. Silwood1]|nr:unnamed protein product [Rotaria sp. Silwood1]CAF0906770.1 unnamed protein product [Rotaria sp. Silwood1]CAF3372156.1 unnamed protein product [Rotaria sp. Silwood1]CAF3374792.1 unnamed protein product [Rotaria sp. Silwood1]CAF4564896.1 unnamed protein product [Rotaria sp. Silwood1]